jgi:alkylated DNA repair dioxygenase AlkB
MSKRDETDSEYIQCIFPRGKEDAESSYMELSQLFKFDPHTGRVAVEDEMKVVNLDGQLRAIYAKGETTVFHPLGARVSVCFGEHPMPHRHTYFAEHSELREPVKENVNKSLKNRVPLQPVIPFSEFPCLGRIRKLVAQATGKGEAFWNFANVNLYAQGRESRLGPHKDQDHRFPVEKGALAATVTLNAPNCKLARVYIFDPDDKSFPKRKITLESGSCNILGRIENTRGSHSIPRQTNATARLSINFRHIPVKKNSRKRWRRGCLNPLV